MAEGVVSPLAKTFAPPPMVSWPSTMTTSAPLKSGHGREGSVYFNVFGPHVNGEPGEVTVEVLARESGLVVALSTNGTCVDLSPDDAENLAEALRRVAKDVRSVESADFLRTAWGLSTDDARPAVE